jgi:GAF domain-containing protein
LDTEQLIRLVVDLVRERFGLYYVGLFLVDSAGQWAILRAGTGEAGQALLERGHRLPVGESSMVGWCIAHAQARVAQEVSEEAARLPTPELPDTRSEAALPLRSRGRVLGALTVQSAQPDAFDAATIAALQAMTDHIAVALDNARLFAESQSFVEMARRASAQASAEGWKKLAHERTAVGYRSSERGLVESQDVWQPEIAQAQSAGQTVRTGGNGAGELVAVPIKVRDVVIGVLDAHAPQGRGWTSEQIAMLETLADQLGAALESARLYRDTQRRAAREQLAREITDKLRRAADIESLMQTTVREMAAALETSDAFVQLLPYAALADDQMGTGEPGKEAGR